MRRLAWGMAACLMALLAAGSGCGLAQEKPEAAARPGLAKVVTVSLREHGWMTSEEIFKEHPITEEGQYKGWIQSGPKGGVAWGGIGDVAVDRQGLVYVALPIWASGVAPRSPVRGEGDKLRVVVVNAAEKGKVERTMDFPTVSLDRLALKLAADGAPIVFANDTLMRLGADGKPTAKLAIHNEQKEYEPWDVRSSTSGRTVKVWLNSKIQLMVDAQTLALEKRCEETDSQNDEGDFTDDMGLMSLVEGLRPKVVYGLEKGPFCGKRERLKEFGDIDFVPAPVDDERFLAIRSDGIALRKLSGETLWSSTAPEGRTLEASETEERISQDGSRVAVRVMRPVIYHEPQSLEGRRAKPQLRRAQFGTNARPKTRTIALEDTIGVWDVATGRLVAQVPIQEAAYGSVFKANASFALSPDGKLVAILQDGVLVVWRVD